MFFTLYFFIFLTSFSTILLLLYLREKVDFISDNVTNKLRKIHSRTVIKIGGISFFSLAILYPYIDNNNVTSNILIISFIFLLIGLAADLKESFSSYSRFTIMFLIILISVFNNNLLITSIDILFIDTLLAYHLIISILFTACCIMMLVNGFNFIDGNNGLLLGTTIIVTFNLLELTNNNNTEIVILLRCLAISSIILFVFNFFTEKIITGDTGAYFIGFLLGAVAIEIYNVNLINPFYIACILFYPILEVLTSFIRRVFFYKKNPLYPDSMHLHSLIFKVLKIKINHKIHFTINSFTSLIILIYLSITSIFIRLSDNYQSTFYYLCISYIILYLVIFYYERKISFSI